MLLSIPTLGGRADSAFNGHLKRPDGAAHRSTPPTHFVAAGPDCHQTLVNVPAALAWVDGVRLTD
jgi:hypothetical protein